LTKHDSVQRIYALNDEAAVLICDYGKVTRPRIPFPYYSEAWTGIEYLFATQLLYTGMVREGVQCFENVRRLFDGERRNPWDEPECGHHYARAMSAWSGIVALSGFHYRGSEKSVVAAPKARMANFSSFWSTATGWGVFSRSNQNGRTRFSLSVLAGNLPCRSVEVVGEAAGNAQSSASPCIISAGVAARAPTCSPASGHFAPRRPGAVTVSSRPLEIASVRCR
jgi:hypothetical protein